MISSSNIDIDPNNVFVDIKTVIKPITTHRSEKIIKLDFVILYCLYFVVVALVIKPRASIAFDKSIDFKNPIVNTGIIRDVNDLTLSKIFPFEKSTPLLACAFIILCASLTNVGTNLKERDSITDHSLTGALNNFNGNNNK
jgi:hypothetical protein